MPTFVCSYAHDIPCYADFVIQAKNEKAALRKIRKCLREGKFQYVETLPNWENEPTNQRVFVHGLAQKHSPDTTLEELVDQGHVFSPKTAVCLRCGRSEDENAVQHSPCPA
jgi:hypothetical protein